MLQCRYKYTASSIKKNKGWIFTGTSQNIKYFNIKMHEVNRTYIYPMSWNGNIFKLLG